MPQPPSRILVRWSGCGADRLGLHAVAPARRASPRSATRAGQHDDPPARDLRPSLSIRPGAPVFQELRQSGYAQLIVAGIGVPR
jgi:hypothetical protein